MFRYGKLPVIHSNIWQFDTADIYNYNSKVTEFDSMQIDFEDGLIIHGVINFESNFNTSWKAAIVKRSCRLREGENWQCGSPISIKKMIKQEGSEHIIEMENEIDFNIAKDIFDLLKNIINENNYADVTEINLTHHCSVSENFNGVLKIQKNPEILQNFLSRKFSKTDFLNKKIFTLQRIGVGQKCKFVFAENSEAKSEYRYQLLHVELYWEDSDF